MKLKQKNVCQTCRDHKIGCDGKRPSCSQCRHTSRVCAGYPSDFEFVATSGNTCKRPRKAQSYARSRPMAKQLSAGPSEQEYHLTKSLSPTIQDAANLIIRSYVPEDEIPWLSQTHDVQPRVCGGWVATLPELLIVRGSNEVLPAAVATLALAISSKRLYPKPTRPTIWESYGSTVKILQESLCHRGGVCNGEYLASLMCLTLTELILNTRKDNWMVHIDGISAMFKSLSPAFFSRGIPHKLFIGFRPLLMFKAIISRTPSFLSDEQWMIRPFHEIPASPMQELLTEAIGIPSVLQRIDRLHTHPKGLQNNEIKALQEALYTILQRLRLWETEYGSKLVRPLYWPQIVGLTNCQNVCLWFPDVAIANALTHYWVLTAICSVHIQKLSLATGDGSLDDLLRQQYLEPLTKICRSIPFLFQESLNLYGSSSAAFLLSTVRDISRWDVQHGGTESALYKDMVDYAMSQGFCFN